MARNIPREREPLSAQKNNNIVANSGADAVRPHMRAALTTVMLALAAGFAIAARLPLFPPRMRPLQVRALLSPATIARACDSSMFSVAQMEYLRASRDSVDARDVVWHRAVTRLVHTHAPERVANNEIMHALDHETTQDGIAVDEVQRGFKSEQIKKNARLEF